MISVESISVFRDGREIVSEFSIEIPVGSIAAIVGPNGSGKSTAIQAISGDLPISAGGVYFDGVDIRKLSIVDLAKRRSVAQQNQRFSLAYTVNEIIEMAIQRSGNRESIEEAVNALDISHLLSRKITSLSGGEQQRVSISLALSQSTPYLFLDEPFAAQDIASVERISSHLKVLRKKGVGILIIAHMLESELSWCDSFTKM